ncbi:hypothetical protein ACFTXM_45140 [Streptomyces sp. NPDC056930]|uniref:hypothetical protein n=1 Tax=Streptomyces sp. NPDC056930 TaxID=3345967 RepID=UPI0036375C2C
MKALGALVDVVDVMGDSWASQAMRWVPSVEVVMTSARHEPSAAGTSSSANHPASRIAAAISSLSMWCSHDSFDNSHEGGRPGSWQKNRTP